jgi:hypothetical protein
MEREQAWRENKHGWRENKHDMHGETDREEKTHNKDIEQA